MRIVLWQSVCHNCSVTTSTKFDIINFHMMHGRALLIDQNRKFTDKLRDLSDENGFTIVTTWKQAAQALKSETTAVSIVYVSTSVPPANGLEVVKQVKEMRPSIPLVLVDHHDFPRVTQEQADGLGCLAVVLKPQSADDLLRPVIERLEAQNSWRDVSATDDAKDVELDLVDKNHIALPIRDFLLTPKSLFNLLIRLSSGKFIKVLNAGDSVDKDFAGKYLEKGLKNFYVRTEEQQRYVNFCDKMVKTVLLKEGIATDAKVAKVLHLGEAVGKGLYQSGITAEKLYFAGNFLEHTEILAHTMKMEDKLGPGLIGQLLGKDHVASVVMLSGLLAQQVGFESGKAVKMVGMAALLHDIGLYDLMPKLENEDSHRLSAEELVIWDKHPARGEEILRAQGGFDETVYQAVSQHHKRKRGELSRRESNNINMVSEIVGLADEFHTQVLHGEFSSEKLKLFLTETLPLFSFKLTEGFAKLIKKPK